MRKGFFAAMLAAALVAGACGGSDETDPTAFGGDDLDLCQELPVDVQDISILGYHVQGVSDVEVCVDADVDVAGTPTLVNYQDCGTPCVAIVVEDLQVSAQPAINVNYKRGGKAQDAISWTPDPAGVEQGTIQKCVVGYGTPNPCTDHITQPKNLTASSSKGQVDLSWMRAQSMGDAEVTGYEVWRSETGETGTFAAVGTSETTRFTDAAVTVGTTYWYYVIALGDGMTSEASEITEITATNKASSDSTKANDSKKKRNRKK